MRIHIRHKVGMMVLMLMLVASTARAQMLSVGTDVAMDVLGAPGLGAELTLGKKSTLAINAMYGKNFLWKGWKIAAVQPEWRVYLSGRPMYHHYFGAIGVLSRYNMTVDGRVKDGDAAGAGVSFGYVLPVGQRLLVDFHTSLGAIYYHQKEYNKGQNYDSTHKNTEGNVYANAHGTVYMPLRMGVTVSYIIK